MGKATAVGDRVGAICAINDGVARMFGFGVYLGHQKPPGFPAPNPTIKLDSGEFVFGYQCWWGSEDGVKSRIAGLEIVNEPVPSENKGFQSSSVAGQSGKGYTPPAGMKVEKLDGN